MQEMFDLGSKSIVDKLHEEDDGSCISIQNIVKKRRHFDLACALFGFIFSTLHLGILIYIRYWQKRKGFFLLLTQAVMSILTLTFLLIGCLIDICTIKLSKGWIVFRAYIWLFIVNSLIAAYGFLIITLCIDRCVALNKPLYYRLVFVRIGLVIFCCVLAMICCIKWAVFNHITPDGDFEENDNVSVIAWRKRIGSTLVQYFISGIVMLVLSYWNVRKLHKLDQAHFQELRMSDISRNQWAKNHKTIAKICIFLAISFCVFNWPYALTDYFYTDELVEQTWYATIELIINLCQVLYIQLNLFFYAYCSRTYRATLFRFLTCSTRTIKQNLPCYKGKTWINDKDTPKNPKPKSSLGVTSFLFLLHTSSTS